MKNEIAAAIFPLAMKGRTDARGTKHKGGKPFKEDRPLDLEALTHHANGGPAHGLYPIKPGESVTGVAVLDLDSHKGESTWLEMADAAFKVKAAAQARNLVAHLWRSGGGKGIHLIFTWGQAQDARSVRVVLKEILAECGFKDGAGGVKRGEIEVFPKQDRVAAGGYGNYFFLPGAFESEPLDDLSLDPLGKSAIPGYVWHDSADVPLCAPEASRTYSSAVDVSLDTVASAVASIPNSGASVDYETWFKIVAGIHSADPGEDGHEIAESWSEGSDKHSREWFEHTWANLRADRSEGVGVGTIFHVARLNGWVDPEKIALVAELDQVDIAAAEQVIDGLARTVATVATSVADFPLFMCNNKGIPFAYLSNVKLALENDLTSGGVRLGFDSFRDELMIAERSGQWRPIADVDLVRLRIRFETMQGGIPSIGRDIMRDAVAEVADANRFDSAQMWIRGLSWDGVPRIEKLFSKYFGAVETPYTRAASLYFMTALAGRVLVPGIQADMVPILVGDQGVGKTTGLQCLAPAPEYYAEISLAMKEEDLARLLRGVLLVELGELKGLHAREIEHTKALLTRRHEKWVPKFREFSTTFPRRCAFAGTTNSDEFLEDSTGNRRFLPIRVGVTHRVDRDAIAADMLQLWAEAAAVFEFDWATGGPGVDWKPAERLARAEHDEYTVTDAWSEDVVRWINGREEPTAPFTAVDAIKGSVALAAGQINQGHKKRIAAILKRLGYVDGRRYVDGVRVRAWAKGRDPGTDHDGESGQ